MSNTGDNADFFKFVAEVQSKINVMELYTKLTGEQFELIKSRMKARIVWRADKVPSLSYYAEENILTDFTAIDTKTQKNPGYGPVQLLLKCGGALSFSHALQMACEMVNMDIPDKFQKLNLEGESVTKKEFHAGPKLREIWKMCKDNLESVILDPTKRPINLNRFFEARSIPMDINFVRAMNIGLLPKVDLVNKALKDTDLLRMKKDESKELNMFYEDFGDNAIVFPLYTINGALAGLRSRKFTDKNYTFWIPIKNVPCFYNMDQFRNRPINRRIYMVEGEMNLIAYGISVYHEIKDKENVEIELRNALSIIYSTGSKTNHVDVFHGEVDKLIYVQDNDIKDYDEVPDPTKHPVLETCAKISNEIKANELLVVNWGEVSHAQSKYDLEDYLKFNNYSLASLRDLPLMSLPRFCFNTIKDYIKTISDQDNKRQCQIKFSFELSEKLQDISQRQVFNEIAEKEFSLSSATTKILNDTDKGSSSGPYLLDELGRIVESVATDNGFKIVPKTNFYMKINNEIIKYSIDNKRAKTYTIQVVVGGSKRYEGDLDGSKILDVTELRKFLGNTVNITDLTFYDPSIKDRDFTVVSSIMQAIKNNKTTYVFSSLGRPSETKCTELFNTNKFFLMPDVSVINCDVVDNNGFEIDINNEGDVVKTEFKFKKVDDDEYREVGSLFWNHVRHLHESTLVDTCVSIVFDSCTREMQGTGIVENDHGFPLYLSGQSGAYKSTAAIAAMCLLGDFIDQSDLLSYNATTLSTIFQLQRVGTATHCIDDLKSEDIKSSEFTNIFHSIYGGGTRTRMDSTGSNLRGGQDVKASVILTSEALPNDMSESIAARMLTLRIVHPTKTKAAESKYHLEFMKEPRDDGSCNFHRMSAFLPRIIAWVQKRETKVYAKLLSKWKKHYLSLITGNNIERPADMVSRIISAFELITEFCKEHEICTPQEADQAFQNLVNFWNIQITEQLRRIESHSSKFKVIDILVQILKSEAVGVRTYKGGRWLEAKRNFPSFPIRDVEYPDERGRKIIILAIKPVLHAMNFYMHDSIIVEDKFREDLKESGIIETDKETGKIISYPVPDERGVINDKHKSNNLVIDYNLLIKLSEDLKR